MRVRANGVSPSAWQSDSLPASAQLPASAEASEAQQASNESVQHNNKIYSYTRFKHERT